MKQGISVELDLRKFNAEMSIFRKSLLDWRRAILWFWSGWVTRTYQAWTSVRRGGGTFRGQEWEALADDTRPEKKNAIINMDSGQLMRALFNSPGAGSFKIGPPKVERNSLLLIGDNLPPYAQYAFAMKGRNPAFFAIPEDEKLLVDTATKYIEEEKKKAFGGK